MSAPTDRRLPIIAALAVAAVALVVPSIGAPPRPATGLAALAVLAAFGLACGMAGRRDGPGAPVDLTPLLDRLDRIAAALEARPAAPGPRPDPFATLGRAIAEGRWADADAMLAEAPDHPDARRHAEAVASARLAAGQSLRDELKAAQQVNDPARALEIHAALAAVVTAEALAEIEPDLVKWLLALLMRRLRGGTVGPDVAELAATVAERFPRSVEGASLRASLATLRRSAGLCPRCAKPYKGLADACPACLGAAPATAPTWDDDPEPEDTQAPHPSPDGMDDRVFLDDPT